MEVKIDINQVNLAPCQASWVLSKLSLGGAKDELMPMRVKKQKIGN